MGKIYGPYSFMKEEITMKDIANSLKKIEEN